MNLAFYKHKMGINQMNQLKFQSKLKLLELKYHKKTQILEKFKMISREQLCTIKVSKEKMKTLNTPSLKTKSLDRDNRVLSTKTMGLCQSGSKNASLKTQE